MRKLIVAASAVVLALLLVACTPQEADQLKAVNDFRYVENHLPQFGWEDQLYPAAHAWSQHMADVGAISHPSSLPGNFNPPAGWHKLGQNVAVASSLDGAMTVLENSAPHRANLLDPAFTKIAVGVVQQGGRYWVTEDFLG